MGRRGDFSSSCLGVASHQLRLAAFGWAQLRTARAGEQGLSQIKVARSSSPLRCRFWTKHPLSQKSTSYEICWPLMRPSRAEDVGFVVLRFGQLPFFGASLKYEGHGRTVVTGALLETEMLCVAKRSLKWRGRQSWGFFYCCLR